MRMILQGFKELQKELDALDAKHKKVLASTLTGIAFEVRQSTKDELPNWVNLTRNFLPNSVFYQKATVDTMTAEVGFAPQAQKIMGLLEEGGTRTPEKSSSLAVPIEAKRTGRGGIAASQRPSAVLQRKNVFIGQIGGISAIWRELKNDLELLYVFKKSTQYPGNYTKFYANGHRVVAEVAQAKYEFNFARYFSK